MYIRSASKAWPAPGPKWHLADKDGEKKTACGHVLLYAIETATNPGANVCPRCKK